MFTYVMVITDDNIKCIKHFELSNVIKFHTLYLSFNSNNLNFYSVNFIELKF